MIKAYNILFDRKELKRQIAAEYGCESWGDFKNCCPALAEQKIIELDQFLFFIRVPFWCVVFLAVLVCLVMVG